MTIPQRLDHIQSAQHDREATASRSAASLSSDEALVLMLVPILAELGIGATLGPSDDGEAELFLGPSRHRAKVCVGPPNDDALVILEDLNIALLSQDPVLRGLCHRGLRFTAPKLLRALQYARDDADDVLYLPSSGRFDSLAEKAAAWGIPTKLLQAVAADRGTLLSDGRPLNG
jgi:hypothetical protein